MQPMKRPRFCRILRLSSGAALFGLALSFATISAAETPYTPPLADEDSDEASRNLIGDGAVMLLRGILTEIGPDLEDVGRDMGEALGLMAPALGDLATLMDDVGNYELPEQLENGDILIRRKADAPPPPPVGDGLRQFLPDQDNGGFWKRSKRRKPTLPETEL